MYVCELNIIIEVCMSANNNMNYWSMYVCELKHNYWSKYVCELKHNYWSMYVCELNIIIEVCMFVN